MPALEFGSDALVLVSGANGFIAIHVIRSLLENGCRVRGTVRSTAKIPHLKTTFASYGDRLELVVVPDITVDGAFDEAIKGVDAVEHTASPVEPNFDDPQEAIRPAVNGTTSILNSVIKHGVSVKRVVVTSSCGAIYDISDQPRVFTEADWNQQACKEVEERGRDAGVMHKYRASKTLAEQAAWKLWVDNKARVNWDLTTINPPYVYGPIIHDVDGPDSLNASMRLWWMTVIQGNNDMAAAAAGSSAWVDVRDLALAHILALQKEDAGGKRLLVCAGPYILQDFIDAVHSIDPPPYPNLPVGDTGAGQKVTHMITYDNRKTTEIIGLGSNENPYITKEQCARDIIDDFVKRGWKP